MKNLYDQEGPISQITIAMLCRDSAPYLKKMMPTLEKVEKNYRVNFSYIFLENDSKDSTKKIITSFLLGRSGVLLHPESDTPLNNLSRTEKMAVLRNQVKKNISPDSSWVMLLDTDIYFEESILENLFQHLSKNQDVGMLCANGIEVIKKQGLRKFKRRFRDLKEVINVGNQHTFLTQHHYYDTYAFRDGNGKQFWPSCTFHGCHKCNISKDQRSTASLEIVKSAFGGIALIHSSIISNPSINWSGYGAEGETQCEHVAFCKTIYDHTNFVVAIARDAECYWEIP